MSTTCPTFANVQEAMKRIGPHVRATDVAEVLLPNGDTLRLKLESMQITGSFKVRGAYNRILQLSEEERARGVIAASAGNHAQGVARAARDMGVAATIVMPTTAPLSKISAVESYGAKVILEGAVYDDACNKAWALQRETGATFVHAFDDPDVIAGQGTIGLEIAQEVPDLDVLLVPIGGGGLIAGIALAVKELLPKCQIYGVEPEFAASMQASLRTGKPVLLATAETIADGIAVKSPGACTMAVCENLLDGIVTVDEDEIASAMLYLLEKAKLVTEGAGAAAFAAAMYDRVPLAGKKAMAVLSGGNVDPTMISRIIDKGLAKAGRKIVIKTQVGDRPGQLSSLLSLVSGTGANVVSISHDRIRTDVPVGATAVELELETRDRAHAQQIQFLLRDKRYRILE